nr:MAG TPA: GRB2-binding adapter (GAPT) [Caudoviricetes sp.]DAJ37413.1 MAG TPA: GRB2-binding adapter (GAPT) [Caudoviricetes sp.]DAR53981.1 MAG TPA: GRB2-binding adapter (GAPT) [Caudoviricetes sp.]DAY21912.1 MAG TPA: GRB2-binding adapter (GAPT) [Caudoviricetes sp.]
MQKDYLQVVARLCLLLITIGLIIGVCLFLIMVTVIAATVW